MKLANLERRRQTIHTQPADVIVFRSENQGLSDVLDAVLATPGLPDAHWLVPTFGENVPDCPVPESIRLFPCQSLHPEDILQAAAGCNDALVAVLWHSNSQLCVEQLAEKAGELAARVELDAVFTSSKCENGQPTWFLQSVKNQFEGRPLTLTDIYLAFTPVVRGAILKERIITGGIDQCWCDLAAGQEDQKRVVRDLLEMGLDAAAGNQAEVAKLFLRQAFKVNHWLGENKVCFSELMMGYLKTHAVDNPLQFIRNLADFVPDKSFGRLLFGLKLRSEYFIGQGIGFYHLGSLSRARRKMLQGIGCRPAALSNRGVQSVIFHASLPFLAHSKTPSADLVKDIEAISAIRLINAEHTLGGLTGSTFLVKDRVKPYILRIETSLFDKKYLQRLVDINQAMSSEDIPIACQVASFIPEEGDGRLAWILEEYQRGHFYIPRNMDWRDATQIAKQLGSYLRCLHNINETRLEGLFPEQFFPVKINPLARRIEFLVLRPWREQSFLPQEYLPVIHAADENLQYLTRGETRLCHMDLNGSNIIVSDSKISSIIDWGFANLCDPAWDIASFHYFADEPNILKALLSTYKPVHPDLFRLRVKESLKLYSAFMLAARPRDAFLVSRSHKWLSGQGDL